MSSINQRIREVFNYKHAKPTDIAKQLNLKIGTVSGWTSNNKSIGIQVIRYLGEFYPDINLKWLITGEGDMLCKHENLMVANEPNPLYTKVIENQLEQIEKLKKELEIEKKSQGRSRNRKAAG